AVGDHYAPAEVRAVAGDRGVGQEGDSAAAVEHATSAVDSGVVGNHAVRPDSERAAAPEVDPAADLARVVAAHGGGAEMDGAAGRDADSAAGRGATSTKAVAGRVRADVCMADPDGEIPGLIEAAAARRGSVV